MSYLLKNGNTTRPLVFLMVSSTDHITGLTGVTPTVKISKNGGSFGTPAGTVSEIGGGLYKVAANSTDCNTNGPLWLQATATGADPTDLIFEVVAFDPEQVNLAANITQVLGNSVTATTNGILDVNAKNINNVTAPSYPNNFGVQSIDSAGRVLLQPSQPNVVIPTTSNQWCHRIVEQRQIGVRTCAGVSGKFLQPGDRLCRASEFVSRGRFDELVE